MYSFPNLETVHCSMFSSVSSWPAYRFLRRQVRWSYYGRVTHIVKGFVIVNQTEVDVFLEFSCFFCDPMDVGTLISGSSAFSKYSLNIRKFLVHKLLKPVLGNFKHYFASMRDECNCAVVWTFFDIALLSDWNENGPFPVLWPLLSFPNIECSTFTASSFRIWNSSPGIPSPPLEKTWAL